VVGRVSSGRLLASLVEEPNKYLAKISILGKRSQANLREKLGEDKQEGVRDQQKRRLSIRTVAKCHINQAAQVCPSGDSPPSHIGLFQIKSWRRARFSLTAELTGMKRERG
jgi:hypothetical protein